MPYHLVWNGQTGTGKLFCPDGDCVWQAEMRNHAVNGGFGRWGACPEGTYWLGRPIEVDEPAMGRWFIPVEGVVGRSGIGIHGGGTGLSAPFAPVQGWVPTHGCFRVQNGALEDLAAKLLEVSPATVRFSVLPQGVGAGVEDKWR